jgi:predicted transport protein
LIRSVLDPAGPTAEYSLSSGGTFCAFADVRVTAARWRFSGPARRRPARRVYSGRLRARRSGQPVSDGSGGDSEADHDQQADQQINRNIELIRYKKFADELLLFELEDGFTRDVSIVGHFGTGNLEVTIRNENDFERAKYLIQQSYELS